MTEKSKPKKSEGFNPPSFRPTDKPSFMPTNEPIANSNIPSNSPTNIPSIVPSTYSTTAFPSLAINNSSIFPTNQINKKPINNDNKTLGIIAGSLLASLLCLVAIRFGFMWLKEKVGTSLPRFICIPNSKNNSDCEDGDQVDTIPFNNQFNEQASLLKNFPTSTQDLSTRKNSAISGKSESCSEGEIEDLEPISWMQRLSLNSQRAKSSREQKAGNNISDIIRL